MSDTCQRSTLPTGGSVVSRGILKPALLAAFLSALCLVPALAADPIDFPTEPLISVWEHSDKVDIAPIVKDVGFNTVWTHDKPYDGIMKLEDTLMYRHMMTPGVKYIIGKVNEGKLAGIRVFRVENLIEKSEYVTWLKESLNKLKRR